MDLGKRTDLYVTIKFAVPETTEIPCEELSAWVSDIAFDNNYEITVNDKNGKEIWSKNGIIEAARAAYLSGVH